MVAAAARINVVHAFEEIGLEIFTEPNSGMLIWALEART